jgi:sec-independent protein translocase protein TatA
MFGIGMQELLIILVIALVLFGSKKLPEVGGGLGRAIRNFKRAVSEEDQIDITPTNTNTAKQSETASGPSDGTNRT